MNSPLLLYPLRAQKRYLFTVDVFFSVQKNKDVDSLIMATEPFLEFRFVYKYDGSANYLDAADNKKTKTPLLAYACLKSENY